jgi:hypothetical protein
MRAQRLLVLCVFVCFYGYLVAQGVTTTIELSTTATQTPTPSASPTTTNVPSKPLNAGQIVGIAVNSAVGGSIIIVLLITAVGYAIFFAIKHKQKEQDKTPLV